VIVSGELGIKFSLPPTVTVEDVALANPPGFSRPEMLRVGRVEISLALAPLLRRRVEVGQATLVRPDILLETDRAGHPNWTLTRQAAAASVASTTRAPDADGGAARDGGFAFSVRSIRVVDGRVGFLNMASGRRYDVEIPLLTLAAPVASAAQIAGTVVYGGRTLAISGRTGPLESLRTAGDGAPWPVTLTLDAEGGTLSAAGRISRPLEGRGYNFAVDGTVARLPFAEPTPGAAAPVSQGGSTVPGGVGLNSLPVPTAGIDVAPVFLGIPVASVRNVTVQAEVDDAGQPAPAISALDARIGSAELGGFMAGSRLDDISLTGRDEEPLRVAGRLLYHRSKAEIAVVAGDLAWLGRGASAPVSVDLRWRADPLLGKNPDQGSMGKGSMGKGSMGKGSMGKGSETPETVAPATGARGSVMGRIQDPVHAAGFALDVEANIPNPAEVLDRAPPALRSVEFSAHVTDGPGPETFRVTSSAGDLEGDLQVSLKPRPFVRGVITSRVVHTDVLRIPPGAGFGQGVASRDGEQLEAPDVTSPPRQSDARTASAERTMPEPRTTLVGPLPQGPHGGPDLVISGAALPFGAIRSVDADLSISLDRVTGDDADLNGIHASLSQKDGILRIKPFAIAQPEFAGELNVDATQAEPRVHLTAQARGVPVRQLLAILGLPPAASGSAEIEANLTGTGDTPHAIAATLNGWAGVAIQDGQLDGGMVNPWLERLRPLRVDGGQVTDLRCFAARVDAKDGIAAIQPLVLDTAPLVLNGSGEIDLGRETLALRLRPRMKIEGTAVVVPLRVSGTLAAPSLGIDLSREGLGEGALAGLLLGGKDRTAAASDASCQVALARARDLPPPAEDPASIVPATGPSQPVPPVSPTVPSPMVPTSPVVSPKAPSPTVTDLLHLFLPGLGGKK
jgi:AsmA protein